MEVIGVSEQVSESQCRHVFTPCGPLKTHRVLLQQRATFIIRKLSGCLHNIGIQCDVINIMMGAHVVVVMERLLYHFVYLT